LNPLAKLDFTRNEFGAFEDRRAALIQQKMICLIARRATQLTYGEMCPAP
jgi:hypothetical protein